MIQEEFQEKLFLMLEGIKSSLDKLVEASLKGIESQDDPNYATLREEERDRQLERLFIEKEELDVRLESLSLTRQKLEKEKQELQEALALRNK